MPDHPFARQMCSRLKARLGELEDRARGSLDSIPREWEEIEQLDGHEVGFAVIRRDLEDGDCLVVVRAFVHTLRSPNYLTLGAVGQVRADGFVVTATGETSPAPDEMLWEFR